MKDTDLPFQELTIFLAKKGIQSPQDLIKDVHTLKHFNIEDDDGHLGTLYTQIRPADKPRWSKFFHPQVKGEDIGFVSSSAGVLLCSIEDRAMLLTFDQGWHKVLTEHCDDRFGLRVTLNSIGENRIRSIDKNTLDTVGRLTRVQNSKESGASDFGMDVERDLLRAITGTPADPTLGGTLSGFESLHARVRVDLMTLRRLLARYLEQSEKEDYKAKFPWIEHIGEVKDPVIKDALDLLMLQAIASGQSDKCWLAVPEPIEWQKIAGFRYGKSTKFPERQDIRLDTFCADHGIDATALTVDFLSTHDVHAVDGTNNDRYHWPAYRCLYCEVESGGQTYLFSFGRWYKLSVDFVGEVNIFFRDMPRLDLQLPEYKDISEGAYNERVVNERTGEYALMDCKAIMIGGGYSKIEFCDLMSRANDLIHVKRYGGSGVLSHLFAQGVNSGEAFVSDSEFREKVNSLLPSEYRLADVSPRPNTEIYRVVFAVISGEREEQLTLPFFSRLSLRHAYRTLRGFGYEVYLSKIRVEDAFAKTQKCPPSRRKS